MNDMELAEEIESGKRLMADRSYWLGVSKDEREQIIAALRRGPEPTREAAHQMRQTISHAVARGWCAPANSHKEMDTALAAAIVDEVICAIKESPERPPSGEMVMVPREPTKEMLAAMVVANVEHDKICEGEGWDGVRRSERIYRAMLSAAEGRKS